jgi:hypothetical protein
LAFHLGHADRAVERVVEVDASDVGHVHEVGEGVADGLVGLAVLVVVPGGQQGADAPERTFEGVGRVGGAVWRAARMASAIAGALLMRGSSFRTRRSCPL